MCNVNENLTFDPKVLTRSALRDVEFYSHLLKKAFIRFDDSLNGDDMFCDDIMDFIADLDCFVCSLREYL